MNIKVVTVGEYQTNCYIVEKGNTCIIIDPGAEPERIIANIDYQKDVAGIFITHSHQDHIGAITEIFRKYNCPIYSKSNLKDGKNKVDNFEFEMISFPGHLGDEVAYYFPEYKLMFDGDFVFKGGIGRTDMDGASAMDMKLSVQNILRYPDDISLYPGHGEATTIKAERGNLNYFAKVL